MSFDGFQFAIKINQIVLFTLVNIVYVTLAKKVWGLKIDRVALAILVAYYLVFLTEFIIALIQNSEDFPAKISASLSFSIEQIIILFFLNEMERVKLIITAKNPEQYLLQAKKANQYKWTGIILYTFVCIDTIYRWWLIYQDESKFHDPNTLTQIAINIEILVLFTLQICMIWIFIKLFNYYQRRYLQNNKKASRSSTTRILLKAWVYIIVFQALADLAVRIFIRVLLLYGTDTYNEDWAVNIWMPYFRIFVPWFNFFKVLTLCYLILCMCGVQKKNESSSGNTATQAQPETTGVSGTISFDKLAGFKQHESNNKTFENSKDQTTDDEQMSIKNKRQNRKAKKAAANNQVSLTLAQNAIIRWENIEKGTNGVLGPYKFKKLENPNQDHTSFDPALFETGYENKKNGRLTSVNDSLIDKDLSKSCSDDSFMNAQQTKLYNYQKVIESAAVGNQGLEVFTGFLESLAIAKEKQSKQKQNLLDSNAVP